MTAPALVVRYMDLFHPVDAPEGSDPYPHYGGAVQSIAEELGCQDGQRSHFEVRYGGRRFYVHVRSPHLPLEHHEIVAGLEVPRAYEGRVSLLDVDGNWMWLDLPGMSEQETPSAAYGQAAELICRWVDGT